MIGPPRRSPLFPTPPLSRSARAVGLEHLHPPLALRDPQLDAFEVLGRLDRALVVRDLAEAVLPGGEDPVESEEHTSELQSLAYLVCRLLLEKKKKDVDST